jgi:DNA-binding GntR family transcriptional regulator
MSRAPVREAFRQLVVEGLLESQPQRGTFVARLNRQKIADAIFAREAIECAAVGQAARAPLAQRAQLSAIVSRQAQAAARRDYTTHLAADEEFHQRLLEAAGHPHVWPVLRLARTGMNRIRHLAIPAVGSHRIAIDQHRLIVEAIVAGDSAAAVKAMREHVRAPLGFLDAIEREHPGYFEALSGRLSAKPGPACPWQSLGFRYAPSPAYRLRAAATTAAATPSTTFAIRP